MVKSMLIRWCVLITGATLILIAAALGIGALTLGQVIAYTAEIGEAYADIYVHDIDHGVRHNLNNTPFLSDANSRWALDGLQLAYTTYYPGTADIILCFYQMTVHIHHCYFEVTDYRLTLGFTANSRALTALTRREDGAMELISAAIDSPFYVDKQTLPPELDPNSYAFLPYRRQFAFQMYFGEVVRYPLDAPSLESRQSIVAPSERVIAMAWSADETHLVYVGMMQDEQAATLYLVSAVPETGKMQTTPRVLLRNITGLLRPVMFSENNEYLIFRSNMDGDFDLYTIPTDGSGIMTQLTYNDCLDEAPEFSPDGSQIVYVSDCDNPYGYTDVWIMDADGSNQRPLTRGRGRHFTPRWRPQPGY